MGDFMKRTKTLVAGILSLICEAFLSGLGGYYGYACFVLWIFASGSIEGFRFLILFITIGIMLIIGIIDIVFSSISFSVFKCDAERYQKNRKLLITSSVFKLLLGVGGIVFGSMSFNGGDYLVLPIITLLSGLVLVVCGVLVLVDMKQESKRVSVTQTNLVETETKVEENKQ